MNELEKENLRLKLTLISMIRQFYNYTITHEEANEYNVQYDEEDVSDEFVQCYFHMFESSGEHAWKMLGFENVIVSESKLNKLENELRDRLSNLLSKREETIRR